MFDKLKEAVSDVLGSHADDVKKSADEASKVVDDVKDSAKQAVSDATAGGSVSGDSLKTAAGDLGGLSDKLKAQSSELSGIAEQLGGAGELKEIVSGLSYPIQKDELVAKLQESGVLDKVVGLVKGYAGDRFNNPEEILGLLKGLTK